MSGGCAIVLAAGQSSRMGRDKAGLPWLGGRTLIEWMVGELAAAGWEHVIVAGPHNAEALRALSLGTIVENPSPGRGKTTSIATGVRASPRGARWLLLTAVDQPRSRSVYRRLREEAEQAGAQLVVPGFAERRGHPVVLSAELRDCLLCLDEGRGGLRGLLEERSEGTLRVAFEPDDVRWDVNTPAAYVEARAWFERRR